MDYNRVIKTLKFGFCAIVNLVKRVNLTKVEAKNMPTTLHPEVDVESISESHAHSLFDDFPRNINESHFDHHEINHYHLSFYFEMAVEFINSLAGVLVLMAVCLAGVNLIIVGINSMTGTSFCLFNILISSIITLVVAVLRIAVWNVQSTSFNGQSFYSQDSTHVR